METMAVQTLLTKRRGLSIPPFLRPEFPLTSQQGGESWSVSAIRGGLFSLTREMILRISQFVTTSSGRR
jgi:hypothetical protein